MPEELKGALVLWSALPHQRWAITGHGRLKLVRREMDDYPRVWTFFSFTVTGYLSVWTISTPL